MERSQKSTFRKKLSQTLTDNNISSLELNFKHTLPVTELPQVKNAASAHSYLLDTWDKGTLHLCEEFKVLLLNRNGRVLGVCPLSKGSGSGTVVSHTFLIGLAILANAESIIIAHNHPSGNPLPSSADRMLTVKIKQMCELFKISLLDHIIVTGSEYYSFADTELLSYKPETTHLID